MARDLKLGDIQEADVLDLSHDGRGIARIDGKAVFIEGALPGERVRFRVFKRRRRLDEAGLVEVLTASPDRVVPRCPHFGTCGGCSLQHLAPTAQLVAKERQLLDNLERIGRIRPARVFAPLRGPEWAYRRRARLGVKYVHKKGRVLAGFREREKPYIADIRRCEVLLERFATLPEDLAALVETLSLRDKIPQVEVAAGDDVPGNGARGGASGGVPGQGAPRGPGAGGAAALVFRVMETPGPDDLSKLEAFGERHAVQIYLQTGGLDSITPLGEGYAPLSYTVDENRITLEFGPVDFIQVNREINRSMVAAAVELLQPTSADTVLDLFCGLGNFTLSLGARAARVVGVEGDAALVAKARANAIRNGMGNADFFVDNLFEPARLGEWAQSPYDLVLLDPPRAGAAEILERMPHWRPRRLVYISCHPGSLARDAGILVEGHGYRLIGAGVMDMFPHTTHVESIAVFERHA
ncbi:MAG TPA: 23S rRNA (uracil(1939)-C(5))-methyltransferase RlmD [Steroidobacteraceae bacterium]|nr:23S rRNA (uracil(1939)-C(5))-methyltransferase RlmD [Steroidobacteraceae bacterium]